MHCMYSARSTTPDKAHGCTDSVVASTCATVPDYQIERGTPSAQVSALLIGRKKGNYIGRSKRSMRTTVSERELV